MEQDDEDTDPGESGSRRRIYSAQISQILRDFSRLFHDQEHEHSNRTRALRLWARSALDEATFVGMMYEARKVTQSRGNIARHATDGSPQGTKNRMPYFFTVLEDMIGEAVEE